MLPLDLVQLCSTYQLTDREALANATWAAWDAYRAVDTPNTSAIGIAAGVLYQELGNHAKRQVFRQAGRTDQQLLDCVTILREIAERADRSKVGRRENKAVRAAARPLVDYWTSLGREFKQNDRWEGGEPPLHPEGQHFVWAVLCGLLGRPVAGQLRWIAREFTKQ
jgi:hypothetical protein